MSTSPSVGKNKVVYVTYSLIDQQGQIFEQSDLPVGYIQGAEKGLFPKVEAQLEGRRAGDKISVQLSPEEGFGDYQENLTFTDEIGNVPPQFRQVGAQVQFQNERGEVKDFVVSHIENGKLTVDGNHPLAGQTVTFHVSIVEVRDATAAELSVGEPLAAAASFMLAGNPSGTN